MAVRSSTPSVSVTASPCDPVSDDIIDDLTRNAKRDDATADPERVAIGRLLPLYLVVFVGFVGYSLMITIFTPLLLARRRRACCRVTRLSPPARSCWASLFALYPLAQFFARR